MTSSGLVPRKASHAQPDHCGVCLEPVNDEYGGPMDPSSDKCKARKIYSTSQTTVATSNPMWDKLNSWTTWFRTAMGDIEICWVPIVVCGAAIAVGIGMLWLVIMRYAAKTFVWLSIWTFFLSCLFLSFQFLLYGGVITSDMISSLFQSVEDSALGVETSNIANEIANLNLFGVADGNSQKAYEIAGWIMSAFTIILLLLIVTLFNRIRIAIAILKEASKAVGAMPQLLGFPLATVTLTIGINVYWLVTSLYISSASELEEVQLTFNLSAVGDVGILGRRLSDDNITMGSIGDAAGGVANAAAQQFKQMGNKEWFWLYNFFGFLWTNQVIAGIGCVTIAGAVGDWYWSHPEVAKKSESMGKKPVLRSLGRCFRYHLGSIMFGSFVIAVIQFIRAILAYLDKQTQGLQKKNSVVKILMKVVACILWCFEKLLKYLTKNAYIMIAIHGYSFCTATKEAFTLIIANVARMSVSTSVSNLMILLGKLVIMTLSICVGWFWIQKISYDENDSSSRGSSLGMSAAAFLTFMGSRSTPSC